MKIFIPLSFVFLVLVLGGCSSYRPIVDENEQFQRVGSMQAESDIDTCLTRADRYLESHKNDRLLRETGRGAAGGAILGGVIGALTGDAKTALGGAALGAGIGAAGRATNELSKDKLNPDSLKQKYVTNCLKRKKYVVIGWK